MEEYLEANRRRWDALVSVHRDSEWYDVEGFLAGDLSLRPLERAEVGEVAGKDLLHLQCHFGLDTLSWARLGARVTGVDFAPRAVALAEELAERAGVEARFLCADVYDLPSVLEEEFDVVLSTYGVLCWLPDVPRWARIVSRFVRPGGLFYVADDHPMAGMFGNEEDATELELVAPYFAQREPLRYDPAGSYTGQTTGALGPSYEWPHSLGEVVTALVDAGLDLEFLHEFPFGSWQRFPFMERGDDGWWRLFSVPWDLPLTFSLRARKGPTEAPTPPEESR